MLQEKLDFLLNKYSVSTSAEIFAGEDGYSALIEGIQIPLFEWRFERRFVELQKMLGDGTVSGISAIRCSNISGVELSLKQLYLRELDLCRFLSGHEIVNVTAFRSGTRAINILAVMDNGVNCIIEAANTLPSGSQIIDKHEIIGARGFVCDRVVDTQIPQQSIYLYSNKNEAYTDVDFELYGLSQNEIAAVRAAFALARDISLRTQLLSDKAVLDKLGECVVNSAASGRKINV